MVGYRVPKQPCEKGNMTEHNLTKEPQPIADQWMGKCSCGWQTTVSAYEISDRDTLLVEIDRRYGEHVAQTTTDPVAQRAYDLEKHLETGWYAVSLLNGKWQALAGANGRHCYANMDSHDFDSSHVGYWNGLEWEDINPRY